MLASRISGRAKKAREADHYRWLVGQAAALRSGRSAPADCEGIAEELEAMAASEKRELKNRLVILIAHLLKWLWATAQKASDGRSWRLTIREQPRQLRDLLEDSPSLRPVVPNLLPELYADARQYAIDETDCEDFPAACPWNAEQILSVDFLPDSK